MASTTDSEEEELKCVGFRPQTRIGECAGCKNVCEECELLMIVDEEDEEEDECDDCEGKCKSNETEKCDDCGVELRIGCANNPSDHSIFNDCCDDCRVEEDLN